jgi:DNA processing protein
MIRIERNLLILVHQINGIGWDTIDCLCKGLSSLLDIRDMDAAELQQKTGIQSKKAELIKSRIEQAMNQDVEEPLRKKGIGILTLWDEDYPNLLKKTSRPPWVIYYRGDLSVLETPMLAMVGTRHPTVYGKTVAHELAKRLANQGWSVVSGLARGIDSQAHRGVLAVDGGKTIAVLGTGLDHIYPKENMALARLIEQNGIVLSEYTPETTPKAGLFPMRNRIIAGLSYGTLVVEASHKSGSLITADLAMNESREIFAVPGPITSPQSVGPLQLIMQGAKLVRCVEDILEEFPWVEPSCLKTPKNGNDSLSGLDVNERKLLEGLSLEPIHIDQLMDIGIFPLAELHTLLLSLQMKKRIKQLPGSFYVRSTLDN